MRASGSSTRRIGRWRSEESPSKAAVIGAPAAAPSSRRQPVPELPQSSGARGSATDMMIRTKNLLRTKKIMNEILQRHTGQPLERIEKDILDASESIQKNLGVRATTFGYPCGQFFVGRGADQREVLWSRRVGAEDDTVGVHPAQPVPLVDDRHGLPLGHLDAHVVRPGARREGERLRPGHRGRQQDEQPGHREPLDGPAPHHRVVIPISCISRSALVDVARPGRRR